ncbi:hypothetical protein HNQ56_003651 [Anaerotaenia torta]|uniref:DUF5711 family protein n=1 Tax=Anaerotaenia torta TaxID=433293 RepID=UPI003D20AF59
MAKDNEGQSIRDYGSRKKRIRRRRNFIIAVALIALLIGGGVYLYKLYNKSYTGYEVSHSQENPTESGAKYLRYNGGVLKYSKDGATAIAKDGSLRWNGSYEMKKPVVDICEKYVVIADQGGTLLKIFDEDGVAGSIPTVNNIIKAEVSAKGIVAVLLEEERANYIKLFDTDGTELVGMATSAETDGYPMDITLSNDGRKLITSYLAVTSGELVGITTFYNFGEVGQNFMENIMGAFKFEGLVVPRVIFNNNEAACIFKENGITILKYSEKPEEVKEETYERKIESILHNEKYAGVVLEKAETGYRELILYSLDGTKVLDQKLDFDFDHIYLSGDEIIMYDNLSCVIMKLSGRVKFRHTFDMNIDAFYPINHLDRYFLINDTGISQINLIE